MSVWYFYWHNKLTNKMGQLDAVVEYWDVKGTFSDYMLPGREDCGWVVTDEKLASHPCNEKCSCVSVGNLRFPPS